MTAIQAYRAKDLQKALEQLTEIVALDADNPVWYERRGQVSAVRCCALSRDQSCALYAGVHVCVCARATSCLRNVSSGLYN